MVQKHCQKFQSPE